MDCALCCRVGGAGRIGSMIAGPRRFYERHRITLKYRVRKSRLSVTMRQSHAASNKVFVNDAGDSAQIAANQDRQ